MIHRTNVKKQAYPKLGPLTIAAILLLATISMGQQYDTTWATHFTFPNGRTTEVFSCAVRDGYVYLAGRTAPDPYDDFLVAKLNGTTGQIVWARNHDGGWNENDVASSLCLDDSGMVYAVGRSNDSSGGIWATVMKCRPDNGDTIWVRNYTMATGATCIGASGIFHDGFLYVCGISHVALNENVWLAKIDPASGDTVWGRIHDVTPGYTHGARSIACDSAGNLYLAGYVDSASSRLLAMKCDPANGAASWTRLYTIGGWSLNGYAVAYRAGALYAVADADSDVAVTAAVVRLDPANGDTLWTRRDTSASAMNSAQARGCAVHSGGDVFVAGYAFNDQSNNDLRVWRHQPDGHLVSSYRYAGNPLWGDGGLACEIDTDDNFYAAGESVEGGTLTGLVLKLHTIATGVGQLTLIPQQRTLYAYRNTIHFLLEKEGPITLAIYNVQGQRMAVLIDSKKLTSGKHAVAWDDHAASGLYFVQLKACSSVSCCKMLILK